MKNYSKPVSVLAKIVEIVLWVATILLVGALIFTFFDPSMGENMFISGEDTLSLFGLDAENILSSLASFRFLLGYAIIAYGLGAMISRNISLISRSLAKATTFNDENTPFSKDNVRMVREIGIFSISISIVGLLTSWIVRLVSSGMVEISMGLGGIFMGLVILYLSTIFSYGVDLQKDVEGLV